MEESGDPAKDRCLARHRSAQWALCRRIARRDVVELGSSATSVNWECFQTRSAITQGPCQSQDDYRHARVIRTLLAVPGSYTWLYSHSHTGKCDCAKVPHNTLTRPPYLGSRLTDQCGAPAEASAAWRSSFVRLLWICFFNFTDRASAVCSKFQMLVSTTICKQSPFIGLVKQSATITVVSIHRMMSVGSAHLSSKSFTSAHASPSFLHRSCRREGSSIPRRLSTVLATGFCKVSRALRQSVSQADFMNFAAVVSHCLRSNAPCTSAMAARIKSADSTTSLNWYVSDLMVLFTTRCCTVLEMEIKWHLTSSSTIAFVFVNRMTLAPCDRNDSRISQSSRYSNSLP